MISASGLGRSFNGHVAVEDVSFDLPPGSLLALLGPNGAGKTTTVRLLLGLIRPTTGTARVANIGVGDDPQSQRRLRAACGFLTEAPGFYERRSALDNLTFFGRLYDVGPELDQRIAHYLREFDLWDHRDKPVGAFSKGMKQRLAIIRAVFHEPTVLFLDEPTAGLDPEASLEVREMIAHLKSQGRTILVCTHNLAEAERLADWVAILRRRLVVFDTLDHLQRAGAGAPVVIRVRGPAAPWSEVAARVPGTAGTAVADDTLMVELSSASPPPVPELVAALAAAGAPILEVTQRRPTLEAVYLASMREDA